MHQLKSSEKKKPQTWSRKQQQTDEITDWYFVSKFNFFLDSVA